MIENIPLIKMSFDLVNDICNFHAIIGHYQSLMHFLWSYKCESLMWSCHDKKQQADINLLIC